MLNSKSTVIKRIFFIILSILLVTGAAGVGYTLTQRYKGTIIEAYDDFLDSISVKINSFGSEILNETSELE